MRKAKVDSFGSMKMILFYQKWKFIQIERGQMQKIQACNFQHLDRVFL